MVELFVCPMQCICIGQNIKSSERQSMLASMRPTFEAPYLHNGARYVVIIQWTIYCKALVTNRMVK